jgi:transglutaminase-like putative cysteine protease
MTKTHKLQKTPILANLWRRLQEIPPPQTEESILLRVLVQLLVCVGIIATDVAIEEPENLWAIPVSLVGATWSWYRRKERNIAMKFLIAMTMLVALGLFFQRLLGELNDTRLVLAQLLIQLQVLHSFDLPRRRDLGYSMVIGLILLGVAGTLSQTLTFGPVLLVFLAIAIPTLVLDYRSRLGLEPLEAKRKKGENKKNIWQSFKGTLSFKGFAVILLATVAIGLTIFACLPRVPGYQLRTFPVSAPIQYQGEFDTRKISNPGYLRGGNKDGKGGGRGRSPEKGAGEVDQDYYYGFNTTINQNLRGEMKPKVLMRVRSQAPGFWRVLAFDHYTGQGWEISRNNQTEKIARSRWSYQFYLNHYPNAPRIQEVIQSFTLVSDMTNLIPALAKPKELFFPTEDVAVDTEGSLRSPVDLQQGLTYTVVSNVPYRDRNALSKTSTNYQKNIQKYYLPVPPEIAKKVREKTEEILAAKSRVAKSDKVIDSPYEKALYLAQYLKQNPNYKLEKAAPFLEDTEDLVNAFLFGYQNSPAGKTITGGYPDHFATVMTIMLRSIGIPARVVAGFDPGQFNPFTGLYIVKNTDAYLMTEVFFPGHGWVPFNPIPGYPLYPPSIEDHQTFSALETFWKWIAGWLPSPVTGWLNNVVGAIVTWLAQVISWFLGLFSKGWQGTLMGLLVAIAGGFVGWLTWQGWRQWRYRRWLGKLAPIEGIYQEMLQDLAQKGYAKHRSQTPIEYAVSMRQYSSIDEAEIIEEVSQAYMRWRYGGYGANISQLRQLVQNLKRAQLKKLKARLFRE